MAIEKLDWTGEELEEWTKVYIACTYLFSNRWALVVSAKIWCAFQEPNLEKIHIMTTVNVKTSRPSSYFCPCHKGRLLKAADISGTTKSLANPLLVGPFESYCHSLAPYQWTYKGKEMDGVPRTSQSSLYLLSNVKVAVNGQYRTLEVMDGFGEEFIWGVLKELLQEELCRGCQ